MSGTTMAIIYLAIQGLGSAILIGLLVRAYFKLTARVQRLEEINDKRKA